MFKKEVNMTSYQIYEKYDKLLKEKLDEEVLEVCINNSIFLKRFKTPVEVENIVRLRVSGKSYAEIAKLTNFHSSTIREKCHRTLSFYNAHIRKLRSDELNNAELANIQVFKRNVKLYDVDINLLAAEIAKLPIWNIEDEKERYDTLVKWFYEEAK